MLSLPPVSKADRIVRASRRKRDDDDGSQAAPAERRERGQPAEERRKGSRRREDREPSHSQSRPGRAFAPLVAQLIATSIGAPQTRPRRRAAVQDAIDAYAKLAGPPPPKGGSSA